MSSLLSCTHRSFCAETRASPVSSAAAAAQILWAPLIVLGTASSPQRTQGNLREGVVRGGCPLSAVECNLMGLKAHSVECEARGIRFPFLLWA